MRLAFMGSPDFAVPALRALHAAGHEIAAVYCQPPRPAGRGHAVRPCPVHAAAEALGLPVRTPARLRRDAAEHAAFAALDLDAAVVAAYGLILPAADAGRAAARLPEHPCQPAAALARRGADPGRDPGRRRRDRHHHHADGRGAGHRPDAAARGGADHRRAPTAAALHDALAAIGARLILRALAEDPPPVPQPEEGATYAPKLTREDGRIDWTRDAAALDRRVRALNPWPGTFSHARRRDAEGPGGAAGSRHAARPARCWTTRCWWPAAAARCG